MTRCWRRAGTGIVASPRALCNALNASSITPSVSSLTCSGPPRLHTRLWIIGIRRKDAKSELVEHLG
eukprot:5921091-Prymnesium_polylepis.1